MKKGFFLTFEGSDGCGKSTQAGLLIKKLKKLGFNVVHTREPGGTIVAEAVRKILLDPKSKISPIAELFLYEACRAQHTEEIISPALKAGKAVICERYTDATIAYQGFGRNIDKKIIFQLNGIATANLNPDLTIFFDVDVKKGLSRTDKRGKKDRLEKESVPFYQKVRNGYLWLAKRYPERIKVIKADDTIDNIAGEIFEIVAERLKK